MVDSSVAGISAADNPTSETAQAEIPPPDRSADHTNSLAKAPDA
jgi:hypothetical protein